MEYTLRFFPSWLMVLIYFPPHDSIVFQDAILSSCADIRTSSIQSFLASSRPRLSIVFASHLPRAIGRSPYPICPHAHPSTARFGWFIWWRIWIAQRILSSSMKKKSVAGTQDEVWIFSSVSSKNSSKLSHLNNALGLLGVSNFFHSSIISR
jgi:hypothetical protein